MDKLGPYDLNTIITGDARELAKAIPDESIDLIFTDPVYDRIDDYRWLAETAARVLKPDSACLVWLATPLLPLVLEAMKSLAYRWLFINYWAGGPQPRVDFGFCKYKACLWMEKGHAATNRITFDVVQTVTIPQRAVSQNHVWNKSPEPIREWTSAFTQAGAIVADFFCGGGTVPAMCKMVGRNYLAFEIDPATADNARQRVEMTQPPLFVLQPEQLELAIGD